MRTGEGQAGVRTGEGSSPGDSRVGFQERESNPQSKSTAEMSGRMGLLRGGDGPLSQEQP